MDSYGITIAVWVGSISASADNTRRLGKNLNGLPSGTQVWVLPYTVLPAGWVYNNSTTYPNPGHVIRKL